MRHLLKHIACLQRANIEHGISKVQELAFTCTDRKLSEDADQEYHGNRDSAH